MLSPKLLQPCYYSQQRKISFPPQMGLNNAAEPVYYSWLGSILKFTGTFEHLYQGRNANLSENHRWHHLNSNL